MAHIVSLFSSPRPAGAHPAAPPAACEVSPDTRTASPAAPIQFDRAARIRATQAAVRTRAKNCGFVEDIADGFADDAAELIERGYSPARALSIEISRMRAAMRLLVTHGNGPEAA